MLRKTIKKFCTVKLGRQTNQAQGLAQYAKEFMKNGSPDKSVIERTKLFHTDSVICGWSALALKTNAPTVLQKEAEQNYPNRNGAFCLGSSKRVYIEKAIATNCSAVREWDSNGTVFGFRNENKDCQAGEFGHNDFYPVVMAAAQTNSNIDGQQAIKAMVLLDEIRGRLAEVFSLKTYKIDHVVHGAIASAVTYGVLNNATNDQIECAVGMIVAHYIPFRAIRAGKQLSDSKGASAALSTEMAIVAMQRAMNGFIGPKDIFRNPEAIFRLFTKTETYESPFDIYLGHAGNDFSIMGMHFKLGLYEHQSAGAIEAILKLVNQNPVILKDGLDTIDYINIIAYEPAFGIIGDIAKRNPTTRQSADHSMVYIISRLLKKAKENQSALRTKNFNNVWKKMILMPDDYGYDALNCTETRSIMEKIRFEHGGQKYDENYPDGIPTSVEIKTVNGKVYNSGFIMYPSGHARNTVCDLEGILDNKFKMLGKLALPTVSLNRKLKDLQNIENLTNQDLQSLYKCNLVYAEKSIDL